jgi:hypothetical protein
MKTFLLFAVITVSVVACSKSGIDEPSVLDEKKLVGKVWKWGGTPPWVSMQFNSDKTGLERAIKTNYPTTTYYEYSFTWRLDRDSLRLKFKDYNDAAIKVYQLKDSLLTTNNWVIGGISDTTRVSFTLY